MLKKLFNNDYMLSLVKKGLNIVFGFLTLILLNRYLGATLKGGYSYILNYTSIISIVFQFGISTCYGKYKRKKIDNCYDIFIGIAILQFIFYLLITFLVIMVGNLNDNIIIILIVSIISIFTTQIRYINLVEHYKYNSIVVMIMSIVNFLSMLFVYLFCKPSILIAFLVLIIKDVFVLAMFARKVNFKKAFSKLNVKIIINILIDGFLPMLANLLIILNYKVDIIMLKFMNVSYEKIGLYSVGLSFVENLWLIPEIFKDVIQKRSSVDNSCNSINFSLRASSTMLFFLFFVILVFGKLIIRIFFGYEYIGAYETMVILFVGIYSMIFYKIIGTMFIADGKSKTYFLILFFGASINIITNLLLIPIYDIVGAAIASVLSYTVIGVLFLVIYCKKYNVSILDTLFVKKSDIIKIKRFFIK